MIVTVDVSDSLIGLKGGLLTPLATVTSAIGLVLTGVKGDNLVTIVVPPSAGTCDRD